MEARVAGCIHGYCPSGRPWPSGVSPEHSNQQIQQQNVGHDHVEHEEHHDQPRLLGTARDRRVALVDRGITRAAWLMTWWYVRANLV